MISQREVNATVRLFAEGTIMNIAMSSPGDSTSPNRTLID